MDQEQFRRQQLYGFRPYHPFFADPHHLNQLSHQVQSGNPVGINPGILAQSGSTSASGSSSTSSLATSASSSSSHQPSSTLTGSIGSMAQINPSIMSSGSALISSSTHSAMIHGHHPQQHLQQQQHPTAHHNMSHGHHGLSSSSPFNVGSGSGGPSSSGSSSSSHAPHPLHPSSLIQLPHHLLPGAVGLNVAGSSDVRVSAGITTAAHHHQLHSSHHPPHHPQHLSSSSSSQVQQQPHHPSHLLLTASSGGHGTHHGSITTGHPHPSHASSASSHQHHLSSSLTDTSGIIGSKRPRLYVETKAPLHQPLMIDIRGSHDNMMMTGIIDSSQMLSAAAAASGIHGSSSSGASSRKSAAYIPQVEAISPTLPDEDIRNDLSPFKSTKEELLQNINRIDREISQAETQIAKLRKKQQELEASSKSTAEGTEGSSDVSASDNNQRQQLTVAQLVYSDNRKKAHKAHSMMDQLMPASLRASIGLPQYNQPSDTLIYHENQAKFKTFKTKLVEIFKKRSEEKRARESYLTETYDTLMKEWLKKLEKKDSNPTKKSKDNKMREFFEKQFPELRKQREDRERLSRAGQRIRSDADLEDILDGLQEQEMEDKKMRSYAVIPPIIHDSRHKKYLFVNKNGIVEDPLREHKERSLANVWTDDERDTYREKYLLYPKNFGLISSYLERKTVADCVQYYYLSKKSENYRQLLRKHVKKRTRALVKQQQQAAAAAAAAAAANSSVPTSTTSTTSGVKGGRGKNNNAAAAVNNTSSNVTNSSSTTEPSKNDSSEAADHQTSTSVTTSTVISVQDAADTTGATSRLVLPTVPTEGGQTSSTTSELISVSNSIGTCLLCKVPIESVLKSKVVSKINCHLYGIHPDEVPNENSIPNSGLKSDGGSVSRICMECRNKHVRRHCPVPNCKTPDGKDKRLKSLPSKWFDLPLDVRKSYSDELSHFPLDIKKACLRCVMRVSRRIGSISPKSFVAKGNSTMSSHVNHNLDPSGHPSNIWSDEEISGIEKLLKEYGKNWPLISSSLSTKSIKDCKKFYYNFKYKLKLVDLVKSPSSVAIVSSDSDEYWDDFSNDSEETSSADEGGNNCDQMNRINVSNHHEMNSLNYDALTPPPTSSGVIMSSSSSGADLSSRVNVSTCVAGIGSLHDSRGMSTSQASIKSDNDSSATMSADEDTAGPIGSHHHNQSRSNSLSSQVSTTASSSATGALIVDVSSSNSRIQHAPFRHHDSQLLTRPTEGLLSRTSEGLISRGSHPEGLLSTTGRLPAGPSGEGLVTIGIRSQSSAEGLVARNQQVAHIPPQRIPSFLINPNAPTTGINMNRGSQHHSGSASVNSRLTPGIMANSAHINSTGGKEEPTCVRDLIYQAIEMSLQSPSRGSAGVPPASISTTGQTVGAIVNKAVATTGHHPMLMMPESAQHQQHQHHHSGAPGVTTQPHLISSSQHPSASFPHGYEWQKLPTTRGHPAGDMEGRNVVSGSSSSRIGSTASGVVSVAPAHSSVSSSISHPHHQPTQHHPHIHSSSSHPSLSQQPPPPHTVTSSHSHPATSLLDHLPSGDTRMNPPVGVYTRAPTLFGASAVPQSSSSITSRPEGLMMSYADHVLSRGSSDAHSPHHHPLRDHPSIRQSPSPASTHMSVDNNEVQDLSRKSSSSSDRNSSFRGSPSAASSASRSLTPVHLRKPLDHHRPITPTAPSSLRDRPSYSPYPSSSPAVGSGSMPPPAHSNRHESLTPVDSAVGSGRPEYYSRLATPVGSTSSKSTHEQLRSSPVVSRHPPPRTPVGSTSIQGVPPPPPLVSTPNQMSSMYQVSPKGSHASSGKSSDPNRPSGGSITQGTPVMVYGASGPQMIMSSQNIRFAHHQPSPAGSGPPPGPSGYPRGSYEPLLKQMPQMGPEAMGSITLGTPVHPGKKGDDRPSPHQQQIPPKIMKGHPVYDQMVPEPWVMRSSPTNMAMMRAQQQQVHSEYASRLAAAERDRQMERHQKEMEAVLSQSQIMTDYNTAKSHHNKPGDPHPHHPSSAHHHQQQQRGHPDGHPHPSQNPLQNQLLIDFNTSKQMVSRRGSDGEETMIRGSQMDRRGSKDGGGVRLSPHQLQGRPSSDQPPAIYTPYSSASSHGPSNFPQHMNPGSVHHLQPPPGGSRSTSSSPSGPPSDAMSRSFAGRYTPDQRSISQISPNSNRGPPGDTSSGQTSSHSPHHRMPTGPPQMYPPFTSGANFGKGGHPSVSYVQSGHHLPPHHPQDHLGHGRSSVPSYPPGTIGRYPPESLRSITPTTENERSVRQNVIHVPQQQWAHQPPPGSQSSKQQQVMGSVIQTAKSGSDRRPEAVSPVGHSHQYMMPHKKQMSQQQHPVHQQYLQSSAGAGLGSHDAFQTLVNAAAAQQSLIVPGRDDPKSRMHEQQSVRSAHHPSAGPSRDQRQQQQQQTQSHPSQLFSALSYKTSPPKEGPYPPEAEKEMARDRVRQIYMSQVAPTHISPHDVHSLSSRSRSGSEVGSRVPTAHDYVYKHPADGTRRGEAEHPEKRRGSGESVVSGDLPSSHLRPRGHLEHDEGSTILSRSFEKDIPSSKSVNPVQFTTGNLIDAIIAKSLAPPGLPADRQVMVEKDKMDRISMGYPQGPSPPVISVVSGSQKRPSAEMRDGENESAMSQKLVIDIPNSGSGGVHRTLTSRYPVPTAPGHPEYQSVIFKASRESSEEKIRKTPDDSSEERPTRTESRDSRNSTGTPGNLVIVDGQDSKSSTPKPEAITSTTPTPVLVMTDSGEVNRPDSVSSSLSPPPAKVPRMESFESSRPEVKSTPVDSQVSQSSTGLKTPSPNDGSSGATTSSAQGSSQERMPPSSTAVSSSGTVTSEAANKTASSSSSPEPSSKT